MLLHEPGAFAHNRYYAKRLLIDSLDFAYNGVLETLTLNTDDPLITGRYDGSDAGAAIQAALNLHYNDHNGDDQIFDTTQRDSAYTYLDAGDDTATIPITGFQRR